jgi:exopolysaccharide biosynthesis protein
LIKVGPHFLAQTVAHDLHKQIVLKRPKLPEEFSMLESRHHASSQHFTRVQVVAMLIGTLLMMTAACSRDPRTGVPVHTLAVMPDTLTLGLGSTHQLAAVARDSEGKALDGRQVSWTSSSIEKVKVSDTGVATALTAGSAFISATSEDKTGTTRITVLPFRTLAPGVIHRHLWDSAGPWAIHVVEADLKACGVDLRTIKANNSLLGRATTTRLAAQLRKQLSRPVLAAINGDFVTPSGVPIGTQVMGGEIVKTSPTKPTFGLTRDDRPFIATYPLSGELRTRSGRSRTMSLVNEKPDSQSVALYNRFVGSSTPTDTGTVELVVAPLTRAAAVGETVRGVVLRIDTSAAGVTLPESAVVLAGRSETGAFLRTNVVVGDTITWKHRFSDAPGLVTEMIGGYPELLKRGQDVIGEGADRLRHPRTGIGLKPDGTVLMVTVDGRRSGHSVGMSTPELIQLFQKLGATDVLQLDGGGATTMVINGVLANRPSDWGGQRPVANAVAIVGPRSRACR